jgi:uncharacterized membrane protein YozB (DUF420 family)
MGPASRAGDDVVKGGLLGIVAPLYANLILLLEIAMGVGLLIGALLARMRRFRGHAWCQSAIVLLNVVVILLVMGPSFRAHVSPKIPLKLGKPYYALATAHAAVGTITEIAGLYILLAAGTSVLPERFRITNYKLWMRTVLVLWWVVLLLGLATYVRWYIPATHLSWTNWNDSICSSRAS